MARTLMGLTAVQELSDSLRATVETQRALADKVCPRLHPALCCCSGAPSHLTSYLLSQVEAMKEVSVFFNSLVQELGQLREAVVLGLRSLQAEHDKLEDEIRQAQERHQMVGADLRVETLAAASEAMSAAVLSKWLPKAFLFFQFYSKVEKESIKMKNEADLFLQMFSGGC